MLTVRLTSNLFVELSCSETTSVLQLKQTLEPSKTLKSCRIFERRRSGSLDFKWFIVFVAQCVIVGDSASGQFVFREFSPCLGGFNHSPVELYCVRKLLNCCTTIISPSPRTAPARVRRVHFCSSVTCAVSTQLQFAHSGI